MFEFLFGKGKGKAGVSQDQAAAPRAPEPAPGAAPGTAIHFSPDLIDQLKRDHQTLLGLFAALREAFAAGNHTAVAEHLETFRIAIQSHLLVENIRLYIYLEHQLSGDAGSHELIHGFRHEMDAIGKAVMAFIAKYKDIAVDHNLAASFGKDADAVGRVLVDRIKREEATLYPLYLPVY